MARAVAGPTAAFHANVDLAWRERRAPKQFGQRAGNRMGNGKHGNGNLKSEICDLQSLQSAILQSCNWNILILSFSGCDSCWRRLHRRRAELLTSAGFTFETLAVDADEHLRPGEAPAAYVRRLAGEKSARGLDVLSSFDGRDDGGGRRLRDGALGDARR